MTFPAFITGLLLGSAPLLHGAWEIEIHTAFFLAAALGLSLGLARGIWRGEPAVPHPAVAAWLAALAVLGGVSALQSPLPAEAFPGWRVELVGLAAFAAGHLLSEEERSGVDRWLRLCAWGLLIVGVAVPDLGYGHIPRPVATLGNENILAAMILMLLPAAGAARDVPLTAGLAALLLWTGSSGAWLGIAAASALAFRGRPSARWALGGAAALFAAVLAAKIAVYGELGLEKFADRAHWWEVAAGLVRARPWWGFGPSSYAYAAASDAAYAGIWKSRFAHQAFLETAAQNGLPYAVLFFGGILAALLPAARGFAALRRLGVAAVLVQSLVDCPLSIPAGLWLFCYLAGSCAALPAASISVAAPWRKPAAGCVLGAALLACLPAIGRLDAERLRGKASRAFTEPGGLARSLELLRRSSRLADDPETQRDMAEIILARPHPGSGGLRAAAFYLRRAQALDPYRASTRTMLFNVERELKKG